ncbi:MAG: hypothetical protein BAJALOKI3v1_330015 [Promethearchaeota archaeon]|jgi:hypothetical protein|nr:MAG: hypothetical protein BAJALOKI3v1_330015 [Candidatus Lokiarchaeota archaeon]
MSSKPRSSGKASASLENLKTTEIRKLKLQKTSNQNSYSRNAIHDDNLEIVKDLQKIIQNCSQLSEKEIWDYCQSQRYFMKLYLQKLNNES